MGFAQVETLQKVCPGIRYAINCGKALPKKRGPELEALIARHRGEANAYAAFDCDNTTVIGSISQVYQITMIEELHFACGPDGMKALMLTGVPDANRPLLAGNPKSTADNLAADMADAYRELLAMKAAGKDYLSSPVFAEFAAKYKALYHGLIAAFGTGVGYPWIGYPIAGYTREEVFAFERHAVRKEMARGGLSQQSFTVPEGQARRAGVCTAEYTRGMAIPPENVALFAALREAGIVPNIVSASNRELLLAVFTAPEFGFNLPEDCIYGYSFKRDAAGRLLAEYTDERLMPQMQGKVDLIRRKLMPRFGGRAPVLVGGDSIGDYAMLTAFPEMDRGLIFNPGQVKDDALGTLVRTALAGGTRYLLQGRDNARAVLVDSPLTAIASRVD